MGWVATTCLFSLTVFWIANAHASTIDGAYVGADSPEHGDVMGEPDWFDVTGMNVTFAEDATLIVDIC